MALGWRFCVKLIGTKKGGGSYVQISLSLSFFFSLFSVTPSTTKALVEAGYTVNVERSPERIFDDEEFEKYV